MPLRIPAHEIEEKIVTLVNKDWENVAIERELLLDGVPAEEIEIWLMRADVMRLVKKRQEANFHIVLGVLIIAIVIVLVLVLNNDNFFLEGTLLVIAIHQIVEGIIRRLKTA